jgi:hypothetical protein
MKGNIDKPAVVVLVTIWFCPMAIAVPITPHHRAYRDVWTERPQSSRNSP